MRADRTDFAPLSAEAAAWAGSLDSSFEGDPVDRLLCATARDHRVALVSKDERLRGYAGPGAEVAIIW